MLVDLLLGMVQGVTEWLPVSSEGVVTAVRSLFVDGSLKEGIFYSLWLHLGTALSAVIAFRRELMFLAKEAFDDPKHPSPLLSYLLLSIFISGLVGFPLLLFVGEGSGRWGALAMALVGVFMVVTGLLQVRKAPQGERSRDQVSFLDAVMAGAVQGLAVLPGLSRSGLTLSVLLARRVQRGEALLLSFLMSIPVSLAAGLYAGIDEGLIASKGPLLGGLVAAAVGFLTIRFLLSVVERVNLASLVVAVGLVIIAGSVWESLS